jgi:poly(3-hydroxybutyrate) depolymerase
MRGMRLPASMVKKDLQFCWCWTYNYYSRFPQTFALSLPLHLADIDTKMSVETTATIASFGGKLLKLAHNASTTECKMAFNLYLPPQATTNKSHKVPLLIWLSGLTCTGDNCSEKGFFQHGASKHGIAVLYPDTSPSILPPHISDI